MIGGCPELSSGHSHYTKQGPEQQGYSLGSVPRVQKVANIFNCWCPLRAPVAVSELKAESREL